MRDFDQLGWEWAAWWALQGDESLELVHRSATELQKEVGALSARLHTSGDVEGANVAAAAQLFLLAMSEMLDPDGTSTFKANIGKRGKGRPFSRLEIARKGHKAAAIVDKLVSGGLIQKAAVADAIKDTGLSRAEVMAWLSNDRRLLKMSPEEIADKYLKRDKESM